MPRKHTACRSPFAAADLTTEGESAAYGGVLLDMSGMNRVLCIDADALTVRTEAGIFWHSLAEELRRQDLDYLSAQLNLNSSVGGTLGAGGIDVNSTRLGGCGELGFDLRTLIPISCVRGNSVKPGTCCNTALPLPTSPNRITTRKSSGRNIRTGNLTEQNQRLLKCSNRQIQAKRIIHASDKPQLHIKRFRLVVLGINHHRIQPHPLRELHSQAQSKSQQILTNALALMTAICRQSPNAQHGGRVTRQFQPGR